MLPPPPEKFEVYMYTFPAFWAIKTVLFLKHLKISVIVVVLNLLFLLISFLLKKNIFSLMKSKQTAVRGPTGDGRPPVTAFIETPD